MIKYGFNVWLNKDNEIEMSDDAFQEVMIFMAGMGIPTEESPNDLDPSFLLERVLNFYKGQFQVKKVNQKKFKEWVDSFLPEDSSALSALGASEWIDCITNIYMDMCGVEFPEEATKRLESEMN